MVAYAGAILIVIAFAFLIDLLGLVEKSMNVIMVSKKAYQVISNPSLNDETKETAMQAHAKTLGGLFIMITLGVCFALTAPIGIAWGLDKAGFLSFDAVISVLLSWPLIIGATVLIVFVIWFRWQKENGN